VASPVVWKGTQKTIKAGFADDRYETVAKRTGDKIKPEIVLQDKLAAPLAKGARVGAAKVSHNGKPWPKSRSSPWRTFHKPVSLPACWILCAFGLPDLD
jgi:D-alanyl-D-alanine carboxypeptidase